MAGGIAHHEMSYRLKKGVDGYVWVRVSFSVIQNQMGEKRLYAVYRDITAEKEEREQVRRRYNELIIQHYRAPGPNALIIGHCNITRNRIIEDVYKRQEDGDEYVVEYRMRKKDGSYIWAHDLGRRIIAENGRPAIVSVCIDITGQKKMQDELLHLYNNIPGAVFRCRYDEDLSVIDANDGLFEFLGYSREEFSAMGSRMSAVIHPEDMPDVTERISEQLRHGSTRCV